jgi:hypothetical protein
MEVRESPAQALRRAIATLVQPPAHAQASPVRGAATGATQTYQVEDVSIAISMFGAPDAITVDGLVTRTGQPVNALVDAPVVLSDGSNSYNARIDRLANFGFDAVTAGTYQLEVHLPDVLIVVANLVVQLSR